MAESISTTIRFAEDVYRRLEEASNKTGLPINSIVVVACLEWLGTHPGGMLGWRAEPDWRRATTPLRPAPLRPGSGITPLGWLSAPGPAAAEPHSMYAFEMFSASAQRALELAQRQAEARGQNHIGTEHLLLGLALSEHGLAARVMEALEVTQEQVAGRLETGEKPAGRRRRLLPTSNLRSVIRLAYDEARRLDLGYVGTEHLLLGIFFAANNAGVRMLAELGVTEQRLRDELTKLAGAEEA